MPLLPSIARRLPVGRWRPRPGHGPRTTSFAGPDGVAAIAFVAVAVPLLVLLVFEWRWGWVLALASLMICAGFRHGVVIGPTGIRYARRWMGIPWRTRRFPLDAKVGSWSTLDAPDNDGVCFGDDSSVVLDPHPDRVEALRAEIAQAIRAALQ